MSRGIHTLGNVLRHQDDAAWLPTLCDRGAPLWGDSAALTVDAAGAVVASFLSR